MMPGNDATLADLIVRAYAAIAEAARRDPVRLPRPLDGEEPGA